MNDGGPTVSPAVIAFDERGDLPPRSLTHDDVYHPRAGALEQADRVFIEGNGLPVRWQGRAGFVVLESGFGLGGNFLATLRAWRGDARRCARLHYLAIDRQPPTRQDLARAWRHAHGMDEALQRDLDRLLRAWPACTPGIHAIPFADHRVTLLLAWNDVHRAMREWVARVDAFYLDGFAPAKNPDMWDEDMFRGVRRLAAPGATAATWSTARQVRDGLKAAGFVAERVVGFDTKRHALRAHKAAMKVEHDTLAALGPRLNLQAHEDVLVVGAGLAAAHVVSSLHHRGMRCVVLESQGAIAMGASAGRAGIFHGTVHQHDSVHARLLRAAAMLATHTHRQAIEQGVDGAVDGLLRFEQAAGASHATLAARGAPWPAEWVRSVAGDEAVALSGVSHQPQGDTPHGWWFAGAGWIDPQGLTRHLLGKAHRVVLHARVDRLQRAADGDGSWLALDAQGRALAGARCVVLTNADDAARLCPWAAWPLRRVRGQSECTGPGALEGLPRAPVTGDGYAIPLRDGRLLFGATAHPDDPCADARADDSLHNLARLASLTGLRPPADAVLEHRVGWRTTTPDRLPLVGAVPAASFRLAGDKLPARRVPREAGLYVATAFGSRGLTLAPLAGELMAASILREPLALETSLVAAVDAARYVAGGAQPIKD